MMKRLISTSLVISLAMIQTANFSFAQGDDAASVEEIELKVESKNSVNSELEKARNLRKLARYHEATKILEALVKEEKAKSSPDSKVLAEVYKELSEVLKLEDRKADFYEALEYSNAYSENRKPELERAAYYMNQSAGLLTKSKEHEEAEKLLRRADRILKSKPDSKISIEHRPGVLNNLSNSLIYQNRFAEAAKLLEEELALRLKVTPEGDEGIQNARHKLGVIYTRVGKLDEAIEQRKKYLAWAKSHDCVIGGETRDVFGSLIDNYLAQKDTEKAFEAASSYYDEVEKDSYSTIEEKSEARYRLASAYLLKKNYESAFKQLEEARVLIEKHCGLNTSAEVYLLIKELDVAMSANNTDRIRRVEERIEKVSGFRGESTTNDAFNKVELAKVYRKHHKLAEARKILADLLKLPVMNLASNLEKRVVVQNQLKQTVKQLARSKGKDAKAKTITLKGMDLTLCNLDNATARDFGLPKKQTGLLITEVDSKSDPIFQEGDIIAFLNGKELDNPSIMQDFIKGKNKEAKLSFFVIRYGEGTAVLLEI